MNVCRNGADDIGCVAVIGDGCRGAIEADVGVIGTLARIDDMTQQIPLRILRARISHVQAETPEDDLGIG